MIRPVLLSIETLLSGSEVILNVGFPVPPVTVIESVTAVCPNVLIIVEMFGIDITGLTCNWIDVVLATDKPSVAVTVS